MYFEQKEYESLENNKHSKNNNYWIGEDLIILVSLFKKFQDGRDHITQKSV